VIGRDGKRAALGWGLVFVWLMLGRAHAESLSSSLQQRVRAATFEVVQLKPAVDTVTYEKELPLELIPYQQRIDKYRSIGTAFAIGANRFVTAAHVIAAGEGSQFGLPALRTADGEVFAIDKIIKYSLAEDFVVFSLQKTPPGNATLTAGGHPQLNETVYAVGNALGEGIVIRDGVFTSETPEEDQGRWQWLRFTAAASPGNSGGPLLDHSGKVIGVVLRKSATENLNFAVPFNLVAGAPETEAQVDGREPYRLPVMDASEIVETHERIPLPASLTDLYAALGRIKEAAFQRGQTKLREEFAGRLFPHGPTSAELLVTSSRAPFPRLIHETSDRVWSVAADQPHVVQLDQNGFVQFLNNLFQMRAPDNVELATLYGDSKLQMDLLLKGAVSLHRAVGSDSVKVTSLGAAIEQASFTDDYGRTWQSKVWAIPYQDAYLVSINLPTPQGYVSVLTEAPSSAKVRVQQQQKFLANFVYFSVTGSLARWREYLATGSVPPAIAALNIEIDPDRQVRLHSKRMEFAATGDLLKLDKTGVLLLEMSFFADAGGVVWDLGGIALGENPRGGNWLEVHREVKPESSLPDSFQSNWSKLSAGEFPYNANAFSTGKGGTRINIAAPPLGAPVRYELSVFAEGEQNQAVMRQKLAHLEHNFKALER